MEIQDDIWPLRKLYDRNFWYQKAQKLDDKVLEIVSLIDARSTLGLEAIKEVYHYLPRLKYSLDEDISFDPFFKS